MRSSYVWFIQYEITIEQFNGDAVYSAAPANSKTISILITSIQSLSSGLKRLMKSSRLLPDLYTYFSSRTLERYLSGGNIMDIVSHKGFY